MKIEQIDLKAYGHFSNQRIALGGGAGFHIICGPNEAGKTTLWRAINGALFGFPEQTRDGYLHTNPKLRVGLELSSRSGDRLAIMRRKGRVNTLLAYDPASGVESQQTIADERLREWLGGLSQGLFLAMFSLDHDALLRGGEALAQGKGDAGESLFEAGAGLSSIRALRLRLDREAESLFKPRASTSIIYKALGEYEDLRRQAREAAVRPGDWTSAKAAMEASSGAHQAAILEQSRLHKEGRRLERLAENLPDVAALGLARTRLAELAGVPELLPSASAERIAAVAQEGQAIQAERVARGRLEQHRSELAAIRARINEAILAGAESIEAIHHAATAYREATVQSATSHAAIETAQRAFAGALQQLSGAAPDGGQLPALPDATLLARIRELSSSGANLRVRHEAAVASLDARILACEQLETDLRMLGQDDAGNGLAAYLDSIADHGDPEARARELEIAIAATQAQLDSGAAALALPSAAAVAQTSLPLDTVIQRFRSEDQELQRAVRSIHESMQTMQNHLATLLADIKGLEARGDVPTHQAVVAERSRRNAIWLAIRRHLMPAPGETPAEAPPAQIYEQAVRSADDAADGLFADAERATRHAEWRVREDQLRSALDLEAGRADALRAQQQALRQQWQDLLAVHRLPAIGISEADAWLARRAAFVQKLEVNASRRSEAAGERALAQGIRSRIAELFHQQHIDPPAAHAGLSELLAQARLIAQQHADQRTQRKLKEAALAAALVERAHAVKAEAASRAGLDAWQHQWREAMQAIGLADSAGAEEAAARIEQYSRLKQAHDALETARTEAQRARIRIDDFRQRVAEAWQLARGEVLGKEQGRHEFLAVDLYRELSDARALAQQQATLQQQVQDDQRAVELALDSAAHARAVLASLMQQAACASLDALELLEQQSALRASLIARVRDIEERLVRSFGVPLGDVLEQAAGLQPDAVAEALEHNTRVSADNTALVQQLHEDYLACRQAFLRMDGSAAAADAQQGLAQQSARLSELSTDYAASRLAAAILAQVIETYQKRNQGPLIERASRHFAAITSQRYAGVVIDYDEDRQILKAVRFDGERLAMEQLSTGRRDQLYLALRLAAIEGHLEQGEALPVIVDDILIQFDDAAAAATFKVLATLAQRTQILFLTHHDHLLAIAEAAIGPDAFRPHQLGR